MVGSPCGQVFNQFSFPEYVQGAGERMYRDRSCGGVERFPVSFCLLEPIGSNRCGWALLPPEPAHAGHAQGYVRGYVQGTCRACMGYVRCPQNFPRRQLLTHVAKWHAGKGQEDSEGVCVCVCVRVQQICVGIYGYLRIRVGMCGYAWVCGGKCRVCAGYVRECVGVFQYVRSKHLAYTHCICFPNF